MALLTGALNLDGRRRLRGHCALLLQADECLRQKLFQMCLQRATLNGAVMTKSPFGHSAQLERGQIVTRGALKREGV